MNVTIKVGEWEMMKHGSLVNNTPFGRLRVWQSSDKTYNAEVWPGHGVIVEIADGFASGADAMHAAQQWYVGKVMDCLEPADRDAVDEFAKLREGV